MLLSQMIEVLPTFLDANVPVEIGSSPGVGKSESIDSLITRLSNRDGFEWGVRKIFIATQTPVDLLGYLVPGHADFTDPDTGEIKRHRAFYIIDRSIPVGFQRGQDLNVEKTIVLKRYIQTS